MGSSGELRERWYGGLVLPVLPTISAAIDKVRSDPANDPWAVPRTGLGGAMVMHVAQGFGTRRWRRKSGRLAVMAVEAWNQRVWTHTPGEAERSALLERDVGRLGSVWSDLLKRDAVLVGRVLDRLFDAEGAGDHAVPEAVLFLRGAVAAGVVAGDVPDDVHAMLDRHVTWLGLAWEGAQGSLTSASWRGALLSVGLPDLELPAAPVEVARAEAMCTLASLPAGSPTALFQDILGNLTSAASPTRDHAAWLPQRAPEPAPLVARAWADGTRLGNFRDTWAEPIEATLSELAATESEALGRAVLYLRLQGGKRVRPLLSLAAAVACGGEPRRALAAGAAVEWLHQGSLVIDDVLDRAALRRGGPTLHTATSVPFAAGVTGFVFSRIHRALRGMHPGIRDRLVEAATALVEGEQAELRHTRDRQLDLTGYYRIIEGKTARLFACAAAVGGLSVEAPPARIKELARFGREVGLAFQIIDDLLDYVGDEKLLGKRPGTDLAEGKMTLPTFVLRVRLSKEEQLRLDAALTRADGLRELAWVQEQMERHDVARSCRARARTHLVRAKLALSRMPSPEGRELLLDLAERLVERRR